MNEQETIEDNEIIFEEIDKIKQNISDMLSMIRLGRNKAAYSAILTAYKTCMQSLLDLSKSLD